jgi:phage terminase Nu1 subunit (DNA packaging protein)
MTIKISILMLLSAIILSQFFYRQLEFCWGKCARNRDERRATANREAALAEMKRLANEQATAQQQNAIEEIDLFNRIYSIAPGISNEYAEYLVAEYKRQLKDISDTILQNAEGMVNIQSFVSAAMKTDAPSTYIKKYKESKLINQDIDFLKKEIEKIK